MEGVEELDEPLSLLCLGDAGGGEVRGGGFGLTMGLDGAKSIQREE